MSQTAINNDKKTISQKSAELEEIISWFSSEDFSLDAALENYKKATTLAAEIETDLTSLRNEITILSEDFTKS